MLVANSMRPEHRAIRTSLSPSDCATRLGALIGNPWNPRSEGTLSGRISEENFRLADGGRSELLGIVVKGQIRQDGEGTILEFDVGPDFPRLVSGALVFLIGAGYFTASIYKIPIFGHILPSIPVRHATGGLQLKAVPFLLIAALLILFFLGRMSFQPRKKALIRNLVRAIDAVVVTQEAA